MPNLRFVFCHRALAGVLLLALTGLCPAASSPSAAPAATPLNVLLVIADDWHFGYAGAYGRDWIETPAFDRVASEGMLFTHAFTPNAKCAPSRAAILTGRNPWQLEAAANHMAHFPPGYLGFMESLAARGWIIGHTGKGWSPGLAHHADGTRRHLTGPAFVERKLAPPTTGISDNDYAANFAAFLDEVPSGRPWCFWLGPTEPHRGFEYGSGASKGGKRPDQVDRVPSYWPDEPEVRTDLIDYAFEIEDLDRQLGRTLAELERRGLRDRTLVIVTSDHGMPFPRVKGHTYHDSVRVPLAIRWPGAVAQPGTVSAALVSLIDLAPTILDATGVSADTSGMQPLTGRSLRGVLAGNDPGRPYILVGRERNDIGRPNDGGYPVRGLLTRDFLYLHNHAIDRWPSGNPETGYLDTDGSPTKTLLLERGRRDRSDRYWQLNFGFRPTFELYDIVADPDCVRNLANDPAQADRVAAMARLLKQELVAEADPRALGHGDIFDRYPPARMPWMSRSPVGFYEAFVAGDRMSTVWINDSDIEPAPLPATPRTDQR